MLVFYFSGVIVTFKCMTSQFFQLKHFEGKMCQQFCLDMLTLILFRKFLPDELFNDDLNKNVTFDDSNAII